MVLAVDEGPTSPEAAAQARTDPECPVEPPVWASDTLTHPPSFSDKSLFSVYSRLLREAREGCGALGKRHLEAVLPAQSPHCWRRKAWERQRGCLSSVRARELK